MMRRAYYEPYPPQPSYHAVGPYGEFRKVSQKAEDTEEVASFLLALKHRSVTPEPLGDDSDRHSKSMMDGRYPPYSYSSYGYEANYREPPRPSAMTDDSELSLETLMGNCQLVQMQDRDLVPDCLFVAMAQMKPCRLTVADRVGSYKTREIGFLGMCCKHCGGQPGFGRYYPNSVRSLAQTTTSQTILKHIGTKCRFCPAHIRNAVLELQQEQATREGLTTQGGRPRYGSRKIFFQRVWARLHGTSFAGEDMDDPKLGDDTSSQTPSDDFDEDTTSSAQSSSHGDYDEVEAAPVPRKRKTSAMPGTNFHHDNHKRFKRSGAEAAAYMLV